MKKALAIVLTFVLCFGVLSLAFATEPEIPEGFTGIYTAEDLDGIRNNLSGKYILMNDIDLSAFGNWTPIGSSSEPFTGELDGNGYSVKNMTIIEDYSGTGIVDFGLFGCTNQSTISNLIVKNSKINIRYIGNEDSKCRFGNIAGFSNMSNFNNCVTYGDVIVEGFSKAEVGGIAGRNKTTVCVLCGNYSDIKIIINSSASQINAGGISGYATAGERECFNYGDITVHGTDINENCVVKVGGIDGKGCENIGLINSYNQGEISVDFSNQNTYVGGLSGDSFVIENCYNVGEIHIPQEFNGYAGAISGSINDEMVSIDRGRLVKNSYYSNKNLIPAHDGINIPESFSEPPFENVKFISEEEMKNQSSFIGFDFENVWVMEENGYPVFRNQPELPESPVTTQPVTTAKPTTANYTKIYTAEDLDGIRNNLSGKYILMNDIDLSAFGNWTPIGSSSEPFTGELNGNGHSVNNMKIQSVYERYAFAGLFGAMNKASVKNIKMQNAEIDITSSEGVYSGLLCGDAKNSIFSNCKTSGVLSINTSAYAYAGGLSGVLSCEYSGGAEKCENNATIIVTLNGNEETSAYIGGVFGVIQGNIEKSCNNGNITVISNLKNKVKGINIGGVAGWSINGTTDNCYNAGNITENTNQEPVVGGISGYSFTVTNCYNYGDLILSSAKDKVGGITGETELYNSFLPAVTEPKNKLENCYYINSISLASSFNHEELIINVIPLEKNDFKDKENFIGFDFENVWVIDETIGRPVFASNEHIEPESTEPSTVETTFVTEPSTEESTTEPSSVPTTEPNNSNGEPCWLIRIIMEIIDFFKWVFSVLDC